MNYKIKDMVIDALAIALVFIATRYIAFTTPYGYFHAGDGLIFTFALVFGRRTGILAGAIGMGLSDFFSPYIAYTIPTIIIKTLMVLIVLTIVGKSNSQPRKLAGMITAGLVGVLGYFTYELFLYDYGVALSMVVPNILQACVVSTLLATFLTPAIKRLNIK